MVESIKSCEHVWREISNYIDGEVDTALRSEMEGHFKTCNRCASVLAGAKNVVQLYGDERMLEVPAGFSRRLEKRLARNASGREQRWSSWSAWLVPAAAVVLIAAGVLLMNSLTFKNFVQSRHAQPGNNVPPDMVVVVSDGSKVFHVAGCPFIHDKASERTMTAKEATQDGYVPCTRCLRQYLKTSLTHQSGPQVAEDADAGQEEEADELLRAAGH
ncbi:MAG: zf-HC2 domain-containing protein [Candidatus Sulfotelmatobacter sp.]